MDEEDVIHDGMPTQLNIRDEGDKNHRRKREHHRAVDKFTNYNGYLLRTSPHKTTCL